MQSKSSPNNKADETKALVTTTPKKPKQRKVTPKIELKHKKFLRALALGKSYTEAAQLATGLKNKNSAAVEAQRMLRNANVQDALDVLLAKHDINLDTALEPIAKGLKANKVAPIAGDFFETEVPDIKTRLAASDRARDLLGIGKVAAAPTVNISFNQHVHEQRERYKL